MSLLGESRLKIERVSHVVKFLIIVQNMVWPSFQNLGISRIIRTNMGRDKASETVVNSLPPATFGGRAEDFVLGIRSDCGKDVQRHRRISRQKVVAISSQNLSGKLGRENRIFTQENKLATEGSLVESQGLVCRSSLIFLGQLGSFNF